MSQTASVIGKSIRFGVRGRLMLAFLCISSFVVLAAVAAVYSFLEIGQSLDQITKAQVFETTLRKSAGYRAIPRIVRYALFSLTSDCNVSSRLQANYKAKSWTLASSAFRATPEIKFEFSTQTRAKYWMNHLSSGTRIQALANSQSSYRSVTIRSITLEFS